MSLMFSHLPAEWRGRPARGYIAYDAAMAPWPWYYTVDFQDDDPAADSLDYGSCATWEEAMACVDAVHRELRRWREHARCVPVRSS